MGTLVGPLGTIPFERDALGYPTIQARSLEESAWARGWFHAYDRLVQIELALAIARGNALALMGEAPLARHIDRMTRLHRFTDDLDEQVAMLSREVATAVDAYCQGFAAGVRARGWPLLLRAAGIKPARYRPQDMILMYRLISWFGLTQLAETPPLILAELAAKGASPAALALLVGDAATAAELASAPVASWPAELDLVAGSAHGGSNAIAVAATRSRSGGALLAADPHMEIARIPPVLYAMHVELPDDDYLTGLGIPGLWWPSFARTKHIGYAYTYGHAAVVDVRVARCRNAEVHDGAAWLPLTQRTCTVKVKKRPAETWTFWDSEIGTIVGDVEATTEVALPCVAWSGLRETYRDFDAGYALLRSRDLDAVATAHRNLTTLSLDAVLVDSGGRIGHVLTGGLDRRPEGSGGVVARSPDGPLARADERTRPVTLDPPSGWIVSANARPIEPAGATWVPMPEPSPRVDRLRSLMSSPTQPFELADLARIVLDACDEGAKRLLAIWAPHLPEHPRARTLVAWAAAQPGHGDDHFAELTLWVALHHEVSRGLLNSVLGTTHTTRLLDELASLMLFQYHLDDALALQRPDHLDAVALRALLAAAFPIALERAADPRNALPRRDRFKNIVFAGKLGWLGFDSKPVTNHGGPTTPNQVTAVTFGAQQLVFGAAGRFLCDMSERGGWYCLSGGASERRFGPGYAGGLEGWARGEFLPIGGARGAAPNAPVPR